MVRRVLRAALSVPAVLGACAACAFVGVLVFSLDLHGDYRLQVKPLLLVLAWRVILSARVCCTFTRGKSRLPLVCVLAYSGKKWFGFVPVYRNRRLHRPTAPWAREKSHP